MRRIPYVAIINHRNVYICPSCMRVIPMDIYKLEEFCPHCYKPINKYAKCLTKWYERYDRALYDYFIDNLWRKDL